MAIHLQLQIPIFPFDSSNISECLAVYTNDNMIEYIANGLTVFSHHKEDYNQFRFITSNFIDKGLCKQVDIQRCFKVSESSVKKYLKKYRDFGPNIFFEKSAVRGSRSHKILNELKQRIQEKLNKEQSINSIAKEEGVSEGAIRHQIKQGLLKKRQN
jgi:hypothetical protein